MRKSKKRGKFKVDPDAKYRSRVSKAEKAHNHRNAQARYYARNAHNIREHRRRQAAEKKEEKRAAKQRRRTTEHSPPPPALETSESSYDQHARSSGAVPQDDSGFGFGTIPTYVGVDCGSSDSQLSFEASFWDPRALSVVNRFHFPSFKPSEESLCAGKSLNSDEILATRALAELGRGGQMDSQSKVSRCSSTTAIHEATAQVAEINSSPLTPPTQKQAAKWRQSVVVGGGDDGRRQYLLRWRNAVATASADSGSEAE
ncbi:hypothetical protein FB45DRAFT_1032108 [Roridomyces roridus]|uniref:Uncharacterized protein n=1 Tax=Roridomyces roridus TaxID=1738132 RepID=A0AAD7BJ11_9AGAR|nr:hypothetical protein FB45DRAFT_1032108 [Roridomyces roridus]